MPKGRIYVGVGGWSFAPWRGVFYPKDLPHAQELDYASRHLTSIEINATFYRTQTLETFTKWRDATPDDFIFSVKAPRYCVTRRSLDDTTVSIQQFFASGVCALGDKLGPILWQFPTSRKYDPAFLEGFLAALPKVSDGLPIRHAIELRHESFANKDVLARARALGVAIVIAGNSDFPLIADITAPFVYARLMGTQARRRQGYDPASLDLWTARARQWAAGSIPEDLPRLNPQKPPRIKRDVFLYAIRGAKVRNPAAAMALIDRLQSIQK